MNTRLAPMMPGNIILGSMFDMLHDRLALTERLAAAGPVVRFRMANITVYHVSHLDGIQHILQDNARNYIKGKAYRRIRDLAGNGLFLSDGEFWLRQRRLMQPAFHQRALGVLMGGMVLETQKSIDRWSLADQPVNIARETAALAIRIVTQALFSSNLSEGEQRLIDAVTILLDEIAYRFEVPFYPGLRFPTTRNRRIRTALHTIDEEIYTIIQNRRSRGSQSDDLLAMLMEARDEETSLVMDDDQLRDEVLVMFAAGHESVANVMAWAFWLLDRHPEVLGKLRDEVDHILQGGNPTAADLPRLAYTQMVFNEVLRLYPPLFIINRQAIHEDVVCGYPIPAGAILSISPYVVQRNPAFWEDPERFDPERFRSERASSRPRFAYFPFGGGPRLCIGRNFAQMEAMIVMAMAAQRLDWALAPGAEVKPAARITLRPSAIPLIVRPRGGR